MRALAAKKYLVTTHSTPTPMPCQQLACARCFARNWQGCQSHMFDQSKIGGGINDAFSRHSQLNLFLGRILHARYDAIILLDVQPSSLQPASAGHSPTR